MYHSLLMYLSTLGPIGYRRGGGTYAALITIPLVWLFQQYLPPALHYMTVCISTVLAMYCVYMVYRQFNGRHDPSEIVIDEVIGCLITFVDLTLSPLRIVCGLVLFRLFDISKWGGLAYLERLPGAWGIMLDDIGAALYARLILALLIMYGWL